MIRFLSLLIVFQCMFPTLLKAQVNWKTCPDAPDSLWCPLWKTDTAEVLSSKDKTKIEQFVQEESLRFIAAMYTQKYNIDSLVSDPISRQLFIRNPFLAEFPVLRNYEYHPKFDVTNLRLHECNDECFLKNVYEVTKYNYFIRPADPERYIIADTLTNFPGNKNFEDLRNQATEVLQQDRHFAVYFKKGQPLRMVGGSAFLSGFPEPVEPEVSEAFATIHFRTKMVGRIKVWPTSLDYSVSYPQLFKKLDTIGSFTNKYRFFIPLKRPIPGAVPDTVNGTYDILARKFFIFTILQPYARPPLMNQEAKLAIVTFPLKKTYGSGYITDKFPTDPLAILKESWDQISVLTIYFTTNLLEVYKSVRYGYTPGFYAYEVKQTFKNKPDVPEDNFPFIRGMSKVEFERMKAKPYVKTACHEGKL